MSETTFPPTPRPKARATYDPTTRLATVTRSDGAATSHSADDYSSELREQIFGRGMTLLLTTLAPTADEAHQKLLNGEWGMRQNGKEKELTSWRVAAAHAMVERSKVKCKKTGETPTSLEQAHAIAGKIGHEQLPKLKLDPDVVRHFGKLNPVDGDVLGSLLDSGAEVEEGA